MTTSPASARRPYLKDPEAIYRESEAIIRREAALDGMPAELAGLAVRLAHAAGDVAILADLRWSAHAVSCGRQALATGAPILVDAEMVRHGVIRARLPAGNEILCTLNDPRVKDLAALLGTTRSAASIELWRDHLPGAVVAIGNAPTALFRLLELCVAENLRPALVLGFPVGFVGAAESKAALAEMPGFDFVTLLGRRGGSALAAAAVNALAGGPALDNAP